MANTSRIGGKKDERRHWGLIQQTTGGTPWPPVFLKMPLLANAKRLDQIPITLDVFFLQVIKQAPPLTDEHE